MVSTKSLGILTGPTATGKTKIALEFANRFGNIEVINADSLLVYRGLSIGSAKPSASELNIVPHHLVDIRNPDEPFTAGEFQRAATSAIHEIHSRGRRALVVGGTGFYLNALLFGTWQAPGSVPEVRRSLENFKNEELFSTLQKQDPDAAQRIGITDRYRLTRALEIFILTGQTPTSLQANLPKNPNSSFHLWILDRDNESMGMRIQSRTQEMIQKGLVAEFQELYSKYPQCKPLSAVGYAQVSSFLTGKSPQGRKIKPGIEGLADEIVLATRQLVKRQRTWFRNQSIKVPQAQWFYLDEEYTQLEDAFKRVYGC